jgi:hypothetical protein
LSNFAQREKKWWLLGCLQLLLLAPHKMILTNHKTQDLLEMLIWKTKKVTKKIEKDSTKPLKGQCFKAKFIS